MKKFITFLFISLFVSQINAAMMPVDLNAESTAVIVSGHDHCQEMASVGHSEEGMSSTNISPTHYCCAVVAILTASPEFFSVKQADVYVRSDISRPKSSIAESIYKPPKNYL
ncbi:hypothetical protein [Polynucleobacter sp. es-MAR-4]|uniref:hypothetical protein n=1 Tax=Polynucleobacter sp. es-MAR-4 TaxID=1855655 RepID=UPI001C0D3EC4|nr:hypothetical protein [Polynucleobacter sp. es-MAR-4]MBU3636641.1 hypothetical protein [Polynucleobacter sp. es-MAR-4]